MRKKLEDLQRLNKIHSWTLQMHIGRAKLETDTADVKNYLSQQFPQECFLIEEVKTHQLSNSLNKSFKLGVRMGMVKQLMESTAWPENVIVKRLKFFVDQTEKTQIDVIMGSCDSKKMSTKLLNTLYINIQGINNEMNGLEYHLNLNKIDLVSLSEVCVKAAEINNLIIQDFTLTLFFCRTDKGYGGV